MMEQSQDVAGARGGWPWPHGPWHVCALLLPALKLLLKDPVPAVRVKVAETLGRLIRIL